MKMKLLVKQYRFINLARLESIEMKFLVKQYRFISLARLEPIEMKALFIVMTAYAVSESKDPFFVKQPTLLFQAH
jgi:hypothetical protein